VRIGQIPQTPCYANLEYTRSEPPSQAFVAMLRLVSLFAADFGGFPDKTNLILIISFLRWILPQLTDYKAMDFGLDILRNML